MTHAGTERRDLTGDERTRLLVLQDELWENYDDEDKVRLRSGRVLTVDEWEWVKSLIRTRALDAVIAQGFTTPNPFVLLLEVVAGRRHEEMLMIHPRHLPADLRELNALEVFRTVEAH